jgi:MYXO-CTERM domain-containing protein
VNGRALSISPDACQAQGGGVDPSGRECAREVCCAYRDGRFETQSLLDCNSAGGVEAGADQCALQAIVCCEAADGSTQYISDVECRNQRGTPIQIAYCRAQVCCQGVARQPVFTTGSECSLTNGQVVPDNQCVQVEPATICCLDRQGNAADVSAIECRIRKGIQVAASECDPTVCCRVGRALEAYDVSAAVCASQGGIAQDDASLCAGEVCCTLRDGTSQTTTPLQCNALGGVGRSDVECVRDVCCATRDGFSVYRDPQECQALLGVAVNFDSCGDQTYCCNANGSYDVVSHAQCTAAGGVMADAYDCSGSVCCENNGSFLRTTGDACVGTPVDMRLCLTLGDAAAVARNALQPSSEGSSSDTAPTPRPSAGGCSTAPVQNGAAGSMLGLALVGLIAARPRRRGAARNVSNQEKA